MVAKKKTEQTKPAGTTVEDEIFKKERWTMYV